MMCMAFCASGWAGMGCVHTAAFDRLINRCVIPLAANEWVYPAFAGTLRRKRIGNTMRRYFFSMLPDFSSTHRKRKGCTGI